MKIKRRALIKIISHARESGGQECCGLMMAEKGDDSTITLVLPAENEDKDCPEKRYMVGHKAYLKAIDMELSGEAKIAGAYHSHPAGKAVPSSYDRELAYPGLLYLIVAMNAHSAQHAAWQLQGNEFVRVPLEVICSRD